MGRKLEDLATRKVSCGFAIGKAQEREVKLQWLRCDSRRDSFSGKPGEMQESNGETGIRVGKRESHEYMCKLRGINPWLNIFFEPIFMK